MKSYRRIEIKAFRHRVALVYGGSSDSAAERINSEVCITNAETYELIEAESVEGKDILTEAISLLQNYLDSLPL